MICKYPSILNIKGFSPVDIYGDKNPSILTDFYHITLHNYIKKERKGTSNSTKTNDYIIILGITIGLRHLQKNGIVHGFLLPSNILLDENFYPIIQNVELTKNLVYNVNAFGHRDLYVYESPEQFEGYETQASNVFSYSFILYYLMTLNIPFDKVYVQILVKLIMKLSPDFLENVGIMIQKKD